MVPYNVLQRHAPQMLPNSVTFFNPWLPVCDAQNTPNAVIHGIQWRHVKIKWLSYLINHCIYWYKWQGLCRMYHNDNKYMINTSILILMFLEEKSSCIRFTWRRQNKVHRGVWDFPPYLRPKTIVPFHKDFSPIGEQLELRKLAHDYNNPLPVI